MECCKKALGNYHVELPTSVATKARGSAGSATPELAPMVKARMACMKETDPDETLQVGKLKELTGDSDSMYLRRLFHESHESKIYSKVFLHCNEVPPTNSPNDKAMKNRVTILPFLSIWSAAAPATEEEQRKLRHYKLDKKFNDRMYEYSRAWMWVAVQTYPQYIEKGVADMPEVVKRSTDAYWDKINYYNNFRNEMLEAETGATVTITEMYDVFLKFLESDYQKKTNKPPKSMFRDNIKKALSGAEFKKDTFHGWKLKMLLI
jgi:phage/plasmid-associated DNA primase